MSNVNTTAGPRQGPADRDVSQIFDNPNGGPYTLPVADLKRTVNVENTKKKLLRKVLYPHLCKKMEASGFSYELSLEEQSYTLLESNAVPSSRTSTVINVTRQLDYKGKEWVWFTTVEKGYDANGVEVAGSGSTVEHFKDKDVLINSIRNDVGEVTKLTLSNKYTDIYTQEYSSELLKEILGGKYEISPKLSLTINEASGKSWSGMNEMEFVELTSKELLYRCKYNRCNEDLTVSFSSMSTAEKLNLTPKQ
jgi:hypothetical protein